jgi:hypothetical protein
VYEEQTGPVIGHYAKSQYYRIDGALAPAEVSALLVRESIPSTFPMPIFATQLLPHKKICGTSSTV